MDLLASPVDFCCDDKTWAPKKGHNCEFTPIEPKKGVHFNLAYFFSSGGIKSF